jgi:hypothetical protein
VYRILFSNRDLPKLRQSHWLPSFPHSAREIWIKQRQFRDLLLAIEPEALWEKHEARRCPRCCPLVRGTSDADDAGATRARFSGEPLEPCGESLELGTFFPYEPEGREFESLRMRHKPAVSA